jgi:hypothetical protein
MREREGYLQAKLKKEKKGQTDDTNLEKKKNTDLS